MPLRTHPALPALAVLLTLVAVPAAPAAAAPSPCAGTRFTATVQADLADLAVLDAGVLRPGLPALADVRLAAAHGSVDSGARPHRTVASGRYADARLLARQLPGLPRPAAPATRHAPPNRAAAGTLAALNAAGLAAVTSGRSTADARWDDAHRCGRPGPLTRSATRLAGLRLFGGGGPTPALRAMRGPGDAGVATSLLRMGSTGSARSTLDLVRLDGDHLALRAAAEVTTADLTLFAGTPQAVSIEVVTPPALAVVAAGDRSRSAVDYRPPVVRVTAAGRPAVTLDSAAATTGFDLRGGLAAAETPRLLSVRLTVGEARRQITGKGVRAEVAALRVEVRLGRAPVLDVALGRLYAEAATPPMKAGARTGVPESVAVAQPGVRQGLGPAPGAAGRDPGGPESAGPESGRSESGRSGSTVAGPGSAAVRPGGDAAAGAGSGRAGQPPVEAGRPAAPGRAPAPPGPVVPPTGRDAKAGGAAAADRVGDERELTPVANVVAAVAGGMLLALLGMGAVLLARRRRATDRA